MKSIRQELFSIAILATKPYLMVGTISDRAKLLLAINSITEQSRKINQYTINRSKGIW